MKILGHELEAESLLDWTSLAMFFEVLIWVYEVTNRNCI